MNQQTLTRPLPPGFTTRLAVLLGLLVVAAGVLFLGFGPIPQPTWYHDFADQRPLLAVPHMLNVSSNEPFLLVGALGLFYLARFAPAGPGGAFREAAERRPFVLFFLGIFLTGIGSSYYHLGPNNERLVWDRLPIMLAVMALFAAVIGERVSRKLGTLLLVPLLLLGPGSVVQWYFSGDLRLYSLVQGYPVVAMPLMLALFPARYTRGRDFLIAIGWYVLAKAGELLDRPVYEALAGLVSGHTLKHLFSAAGAYWVLHMLMRRKAKEQPASPRL
jgi:hypothetical protein